jgi:hypothetical protein
VGIYRWRACCTAARRFTGSGASLEAALHWKVTWVRAAIARSGSQIESFGPFKPRRNAYMSGQQNNKTGRIQMSWVIALFLALFSIPIVQVAADAWNDRPGPQFSLLSAHAGSDSHLAVTRHRHYRLYDPIAPSLPSHAKTS